MASLPNDSVGSQSRSLARALANLDSFAPDRTTSSVEDRHDLLGLPKPTASRLASVREQHGLVRGLGNVSQLGPKTFELGGLFAGPLAARDRQAAPAPGAAGRT